ncbi:membrane dipeptidase [Xylariales sp. AK1849]|nr:membrane dipeptidase [Xylariales sp. AK1849]
MAPPEDYLVKARDLLRQTPLIDGHNDFPYIVRGWHGIDTSKAGFGIQDMPIGQTDLSRLERGLVGGQFWSAFVPCPKQDTEEARLCALRDTLQQIDLIHQLIELHPKKLAHACDSPSVWRAFQSGRIASLIGVEGLHQIGSSLSVLRLFHRLGVRYVTLCHNKHNEFVDSSSPPTARHGGLSLLGNEVVREMNNTGLIIDLSHTSHAAQRQVLELTNAPVIFSHSSSYSVQPHDRNVCDDVLQLLKRNNGLIMICFLPTLCGISGIDRQTPASVQTVAEHIIFVGKRIGYQHVGIGSDFDGMLDGPVELEGVSAYPNLVAELLKRGLSEDDVKAVMGMNILRVLDEVSSYVTRRKKGCPVRDKVCDLVDGVWSDAQRAMLVKSGVEQGLQS